MTRFMFIYRAPAPHADEQPPTPERIEEVMQGWLAWRDHVGAAMVDMGAPLGEGRTVGPSGTRATERELHGYSVVEATGLDAAVELTAGNPHLTLPDGEIEIREVVPVPGA